MSETPRVWQGGLENQTAKGFISTLRTAIATQGMRRRGRGNARLAGRMVFEHATFLSPRPFQCPSPTRF